MSGQSFSMVGIGSSAERLPRPDGLAAPVGEGRRAANLAKAPGYSILTPYRTSSVSRLEPSYRPRTPHFTAWAEKTSTSDVLAPAALLS